MIKKKEDAIYRAAFMTYGMSNQLTVATEELAELQQQICKVLRNKMDKKHLTEELADALNGIAQVMRICDITHAEVQRVRTRKMIRLVKEIAKEQHLTEEEAWQWIKILENT